MLMSGGHDSGIYAHVIGLTLVRGCSTDIILHASAEREDVHRQFVDSKLAGVSDGTDVTRSEKALFSFSAPYEQCCDREDRDLASLGHIVEVQVLGSSQLMLQAWTDNMLVGKGVVDVIRRVLLNRTLVKKLSWKGSQVDG